MMTLAEELDGLKALNNSYGKLVKLNRGTCYKDLGSFDKTKKRKQKSDELICGHYKAVFFEIDKRDGHIKTTSKAVELARVGFVQVTIETEKVKS